MTAEKWGAERATLPVSEPAEFYDDAKSLMDKARELKGDPSLDPRIKIVPHPEENRITRVVITHPINGGAFDVTKNRRITLKTCAPRDSSDKPRGFVVAETFVRPLDSPRDIILSHDFNNSSALKAAETFFENLNSPPPEPNTQN